MKIRYPRSLFGQIIAAHVATMILAALTLPLVIVFLLHGTAERYQSKGLVRQAEAVRQGLGYDGGWHVNLGRTLKQLYAAGYDGRAYAVVAADGRPVTASEASSAETVRIAPRQPSSRFFQTGSIQGLSLPVHRAGKDFWIVVSQDMNNPEVVTDDIVTSFLDRFLIWILPILLLLPLVNAALIWRSTQKVLQVSQRAADIGPTRLDVRLSSQQLPTEVAPLADATNLALDRLEAAFRTQGEFVANVAHELRTPLSALKIQIDEPDETIRRTTAHATIERASHVISQLLDLSSLEQLVIGPDEVFDLTELVRTTVETAAPAVFGGDRRIGLSGPGSAIFVMGRRHLISLALVNLIDNAMRHTPPGTHIEVVIGAEGWVAVEDDGPGVTATDIGSVGKRFWRADHSRSDSAGIGLSIVERIASAHGGRFQAANKPGRGASFTVRLIPAIPRGAETVRST